jgi:hypothetical protein
MSAPAGKIPRERLRYLAQRIHRLGERPLYELFAELAAGADFGDRLEAYAQLHDRADFIRALGGHQLRSLHLVEARDQVQIRNLKRARPPRRGGRRRP